MCAPARAFLQVGRTVLEHDARVRGDSVDDALIEPMLDLLLICRINEHSHASSCFSGQKLRNSIRCNGLFGRFCPWPNLVFVTAEKQFVFPQYLIFGEM